VRAGEPPGVISLIDVATGARKDVVPPVFVEDLAKISPAAPRLLVKGRANAFTNQFEVHDLVPAPGASTRPTVLPVEAMWMDFSPDGRRILTLVPSVFTDGPSVRLNLLDAQSGKPVADPLEGSLAAQPAHYFVSSKWVLIPKMSRLGRLTNYAASLHTTADGRRVGTLSLQLGSNPTLDPSRCAISTTDV
jgi:hypothetical protein